MIDSPCIKVCVMDAEDRYCLGCRRTLEEISWWSTMTEAEQAQVLAALPGRPTPDADRENPDNVTDRLHS